MKRGNQLGWLVLVGGSLLAFAGCGDDDDSSSNNNGGSAAQAGTGQGGEPQGAGGALSDGKDECKVMGELCHEADTGSGPAHVCHEAGHEGDGAACLADFAGCINTCVPDAPKNLSIGAARCEALGELCHPVDDKDGPLHACHELGHDGEPDACAAQFADCAARCLAARDLLEAAGEGGAGGAGQGDHPHAGGAGGAGGATAAAGTAGSAE